MAVFDKRTFDHAIEVVGKATIQGDLELGFATTPTTTVRNIQALGTVANIGFNFIPKGTGTLQVPVSYEALVTSDRDIPNKKYVDDHLVGFPISTILDAPTITQNGFAVTWDNTAAKFTLTTVAGGATYTFQSGIENVGANVVKLGGTALDRHTNITGAFDLSLGITGSRLANIIGFSTNKTEFVAGSGRITLNGGSSSLDLVGSAGSSIIFSTAGALTLTDGQAAGANQRGLRGASNYSANVLANDYIQRIYADNKIAGKDLTSLVTSPTATQNQYSIIWDNTILKYTLALITGGGGGTSNSKEQQFTGNGILSSFTVSNGTITLLSFVDVNGNVQLQNINYTRTGQLIDFGAPIPNGSIVTVHYFEDLSVGIGGGGHTILNNGSPLTQRTNLDFTNGLTAVDTGGNTVVRLGGILSQSTLIGGAGFNLVANGFGLIDLTAINLVAISSSGSGFFFTTETVTHTLQLGQDAGVIFNIGTDADGDMYQRVAGKFTRIPKGTNTQVLTSNGTIASWQNSAGGTPGHAIYNGASLLTTRANLVFSNGLTAADANPNTTVKWGGALTADTAITGAFRLDLGTTGSKLTALLGEVGGASSTIMFTQSNSGITRRFGLADGIGVILDLGSDAIGDIYQRNSGGVLQRLPAVAVNNVLISGGVLTVNSWGKVTPSHLSISTGILLGRTTAATGAAENITVGSGLTLAALNLTLGGVLTSPGGITTLSGNAQMIVFTNTEGITIGTQSGLRGQSTFRVGQNVSTTGNYAVAFGGGTSASATYSFAIGNTALASGAQSFAGGLGFTTGKEVVASGVTTFNFSENTTAQIAGHGAIAPGSVILGGRDHNIANSTNNRAVIIGGDAIKLASGYADFTVVANFAIMTAPGVGTGDDVLTRDAATGKIRKVTAASLSGGGGGITNAAALNELPKTVVALGNIGASGIFIPSNGNINFGDSSLAGADRTLTATGSAGVVNMKFDTKGTTAFYSFNFNTAFPMMLQFEPLGANNIGIRDTSANTYIRLQNTLQAADGDLLIGELTGSNNRLIFFGYDNVNSILRLQAGNGLAGAFNNGNSLYIKGGAAFTGAGNGDGGSLEFISGLHFGAGFDGNITLDSRKSTMRFKADSISFDVGSGGTNGAPYLLIGQRTNTFPNVGGVANAIAIYGEDSALSQVGLSFIAEQAVEALGTFTPSHKVRIQYNGVWYWLQLDLV